MAYVNLWMLLWLNDAILTQVYCQI